MNKEQKEKQEKEVKEEKPAPRPTESMHQPTVTPRTEWKDSLRERYGENDDI